MALNPWQPAPTPTAPLNPYQQVNTPPTVPSPLPTARGSSGPYVVASQGGGGGASATSAESASATQAAQDSRNQLATPLGSPVAIIYGRAQMGVNLVAYPSASASSIRLLSAWGYGPVDAIESVLLDGETTGITKTDYLGTAAQEVAYPPQSNWADDLPYIACSYITYTPTEGGISGLPNFRATLRGRKLYDPRNANHDPDNSSTWTWSQNPALALADFVSNSVYGLGRDVFWNDIVDLANWCDEVLGDGAKRWTINLAIDSANDDAQWLGVLREYAHCFICWADGVMRFFRDGVADYQRALTYADFSPGAENVSLRYTPLSERYTIVQCSYTDTTDPDGWQTSPTPAIVQLDGVLTGEVPRRQLDLNMPGLLTYSEAMRYATWRLNYAQQSNLRLEVEVFDIGLLYLPGLVAEITHPLGLTAKPMRCLSCDMPSPGRWRLVWEEYSANVYQDSTSSEPSHPDTSLPSLTDPPAVASITLVEELFTSGDKTFSRIRASWAAVGYLFCAGYRFKIEGEGIAIETTVAHRQGQTITAVTPPVKDNALYVATVQTLSTIGRLSAVTTASLTALGSLAPPPNLTEFTGVEAGQFVVLQWAGGRDVDFAGYEIRRGSTSQTWGDLDALVTVQDPVYFDVGVPEGSYKYWVAAVDSHGQYSPTPSSVNVTVTVDVGGAIAANAVSSDSGGTHVVAYQAGASLKAVTDYGEDWTDILTAGHTWTADLTYDVWCQHHAATGDMEFVAPEWDVTGAASNRSGVWQFAPTVTELGSAEATYEVSLKPNAGTYTDYSGLSKTGAARYMKSKIAHVGGAGMAIVIDLPYEQQFQGEALTDSGTATSASPAGTVSFAKAFAQAPSVFLTLQALPGSTVPYTCAADSIDTAGFDLYIWDGNGSLVSGASVSWRAEGS